MEVDFEKKQVVVIKTKKGVSVKEIIRRLARYDYKAVLKQRIQMDSP